MYILPSSQINETIQNHSKITTIHRQLTELHFTV